MTITINTVDGKTVRVDNMTARDHLDMMGDWMNRDIICVSAPQLDHHIATAHIVSITIGK